MRPIILVCAPSVRTAPQQSVYETWCQSLESRDLRVEALKRDDYASDPWDQLSRLMKEADGVVVLGFRQLEISQGRWRSGTPEMTSVCATWTSPWMHLEAGMAVASDKPVLAVPEFGVTEGVFAPHNWTSNVFGADAENVDSYEVERWAAAVKSRAGVPSVRS